MRLSLEARERRAVIEPLLFVIIENDKSVRGSFISVCNRAADVLNELFDGDEARYARNRSIRTAAQTVLDTGLIKRGVLKNRINDGFKGEDAIGFSGKTIAGYFKGTKFKNWLEEQRARVGD